MEKELKQLAEQYGWMGLSPKENLRSAMRQVGDAMTCEVIGEKPDLHLLDAAVALYCVATVNERVVDVKAVQGSTLDAIMYKIALAAMRLSPPGQMADRAYTALVYCLGYVQNPKAQLSRLEKAVKEDLEEPKSAPTAKPDPK